MNERLELVVHATITGRTNVDRWETGPDYSTARGDNGRSVVIVLDEGTDRCGRRVDSVSYADCDRIIIRKL